MRFLIFSLIPIFVASCPPESKNFQGFCYYFQTNATQFFDAEDKCNSLGGNLVSIHNGFVNGILTGEFLRILWSR